MGDKFDDIIRQKLDNFKDNGEPDPTAMGDMFSRLGPIGPKAVAMAWVKANALSLTLAASLAGNLLFFGLYSTQEAKISKLEIQIEQLQSEFEENLVEEEVPQAIFIAPKVEKAADEETSLLTKKHLAQTSAPRKESRTSGDSQNSRIPPTEKTAPFTVNKRNSVNMLIGPSGQEQTSNTKHPIQQSESKNNSTTITESYFLVDNEAKEGQSVQNKVVEETKVSRDELLAIKKEKKAVRKELKKYEKSLRTSNKYEKDNIVAQTPEIIDPAKPIKKWRFGLITARSQTKRSGFTTKTSLNIGLRADYTINQTFRLSTGLERMGFTYKVDINKKAYRNGKYDKLPFNTSMPARIYTVSNKGWNVPLQLKFILPEGNKKFKPFVAIGVNNQLISKKEFSRRIITHNNFTSEKVRVLQNEILLANLLFEVGAEVPFKGLDIQMSAFYERDLKKRKPEGFKFNTYGVKLGILLGK